MGKKLGAFEGALVGASEKSAAQVAIAVKMHKSYSDVGLGDGIVVGSRV